jgi:uracil-DNA glycosylase
MEKFLKKEPSKKRTNDDLSVTKVDSKSVEDIPSKKSKGESEFENLEIFLTVESWTTALGEEFKKPYFLSLKEQLVQEDIRKEKVYPPIKEIFNAYNSCPVDKVRVVILGQDPYHGPGQAHGLSFSVKKGVTTPPSLKNIYKELEDDIPKFKTPAHGFLQSWANQGVFLLNATLSVVQGKPNSHEGFGWSKFTDKTISYLGHRSDPVVFILWGKFAQKKQSLINEKVHKVIYAPHPSPFSARTGFFGSKCFSKCNSFLVEWGKDPIDWNVEN